MPNDPIQGFDVSVLIVNPGGGPELVGEFQETEISIKNETEAYLEQNERIARILDGEITIEGKLKRGLINLGIIKSCYGSSSLKRGEKIPKSPRFIITTNINAPDKGMVGKFKLLNAIIPELTVSFGKGKDISTTDYSYKAEGIEEL